MTHKHVFYLRKDVRDSWDQDVGAADASFDQTSQGLPALQAGPAVHHDDAELPAVLKGFVQDVVDQWWAGGLKGVIIEEC